MTDDSKAMALIRELCRECNDDELYRVWFLLTGIMLTRQRICST